MSKIKNEIKRLIRNKFIRTAKFIEWLANIVPLIKKNGTLKVRRYFWDLNFVTPMDEYSMHVEEMLVYSTHALNI